MQMELLLWSGGPAFAEENRSSLRSTEIADDRDLKRNPNLAGLEQAIRRANQETKELSAASASVPPSIPRGNFWTGRGQVQAPALSVAAAGMEELIPDARVFLAMANEPLRVRLEIGRAALKKGLTEEMARQILRVASREDLQGVVEPDGSRSLYLLLPGGQPWVVDGIPFDAIKLKQVTYQGGPPRAEAFADTESDVQQPGGRMAFRGGKIVVDPAVIRPVGGGYVNEAVNEYTTMLEAFRQQVPTGYPIGVGQFVDLTFQGRTMGFVVIAIRRAGDGKEVDARVGRTLRTELATRAENITRQHGLATERGMQEVAKLYERIAKQSSTELTAAAQTLFKLHQAGIVHSHPTLDQFRRRAKGESDPPPIYDFTNAMSFRSMSREEFIARVFNDYRALFYTSLTVFPGRAVELAEYRRLLQLIGSDRLPLERLSEAYFPPQVIRSMEKKFPGASIRKLSSYEEFLPWLARSWRRDRFERGVTWREIAQESGLARVFEEYAGQLYDRLTQPSGPTAAGMEENPGQKIQRQLEQLGKPEPPRVEYRRLAPHQPAHVFYEKHGPLIFAVGQPEEEMLHYRVRFSQSRGRFILSEVEPVRQGSQAHPDLLLFQDRKDSQLGVVTLQTAQPFPFGNQKVLIELREGMHQITLTDLDSTRGTFFFDDRSGPPEELDIPVSWQDWKTAEEVLTVLGNSLLKQGEPPDYDAHSYRKALSKIILSWSVIPAHRRQEVLSHMMISRGWYKEAPGIDPVKSADWVRRFFRIFHHVFYLNSEAILSKGKKGLFLAGRIKRYARVSWRGFSTVTYVEPILSSFQGGFRPSTNDNEVVVLLGDELVEPKLIGLHEAQHMFDTLEMVRLGYRLSGDLGLGNDPFSEVAKGILASQGYLQPSELEFTAYARTMQEIGRRLKTGEITHDPGRFTELMLQVFGGDRYLAHYRLMGENANYHAQAAEDFLEKFQAAVSEKLNTTFEKTTVAMISQQATGKQIEEAAQEVLEGFYLGKLGYVPQYPDVLQAPLIEVSVPDQQDSIPVAAPQTRVLDPMELEPLLPDQSTEFLFTGRLGIQIGETQAVLRESSAGPAMLAVDERGKSWRLPEGRRRSLHGIMVSFSSTPEGRVIRLYNGGSQNAELHPLLQALDAQAGMEEIMSLADEATTQALGFLNQQEISGILPWLGEPGTLRDLREPFSGAEEIQALEGMGMTPLLLSPGMPLPTVGLESSLPILVQPKYRAGMEEKLRELPGVEFVDDPQKARFVIGDEGFVEQLRLRASQAVFLQVNDSTILILTKDFMLLISSQWDKLRPGEVLVVGMQVKGDQAAVLFRYL